MKAIIEVAKSGSAIRAARQQIKPGFLTKKKKKRVKN